MTTLKLAPIRQQILVGSHAFDNCPAPDELQKQIASAKIIVKRTPVPAKPTVHPTMQEEIQFGKFDFYIRGYAEAMKAKSIPVPPWIDERIYF